jgi:hypothetical protein
MIHIKKLNEDVSHENEYLINGSGLFFWNSTLSKEKKLEIIKWYNHLNLNEREYVDILRNEAKDEAESAAAELAAGEDI